MEKSEKQDKVDVKKIYGKQCILPINEFISNIKTDITKGLTSNQVKENKEKYGRNELNSAKPKKWYHFFVSSLITPFNLILIGIILVLFYTDVYLTEPPSYANIIVIIILIALSTLLDFVIVYKSNKDAANLKKMIATTSTVIRDGKKVKVPNSELTVGDVVLLAAGDLIPGDLRLIESNNLRVSQSSLTGESDAIEKLVDSEMHSIDEIESITDLDDVCFMGTNVTSGTGKGVIFKIANDTYFGKISSAINTGKPKTDFQKGTENLSKLLIKFMLVMIPITFFLNANKHSVVIAFTFAVAVAIGITPLLLPVILSSSLGKGAIRMSKKKTIVKRLDSIQNFGAMNILCTDKTGTLTEDKIVLEKYLDIKGNEDIRVLKHAFLNSYFQTGIRGNIDEAVVSRGLENGMDEHINKYELIEEIPFDFTRRRLSVIVSDGNKKQLITKGAVEEILNICTMVDYQKKVMPITNEIKENIKNISKQLNKQGFRVIAICQKNDINDVTKFSVNDEKNMALIGFIGFLDPPKESAKSSIEKLNKAGVRVIVLTGDNLEVTQCICEKVGIKSKKIISGNEIERLPDSGVMRLLRNTNIFVKLSPIQKARIVRLLKEAGNVVGYMGDGINDSPSLTNADVGISVDTAVDIAKETADVILLEKDLHVLLDGITEGRKTFGNLMKYIKMSTSFNFGEVMSVIIASVALPFLPETPIQLLVEGLLYDMGQLTLPFDNVDKEYLKQPHKFKVKALKNFMLFMGPVSSLFDIIVFLALILIFKVREPALFQTIWFSYSIVSNLLGMHIIRTAKIPFIQSNANKMVYASSIGLSILGVLIPFTGLGKVIGLVNIPAEYFSVIIIVPILYCFVAMAAKKIYIKKFGEWI